MYGQGATYDAIEGRFRAVRKQAEKLKGEIDSGQRAPAPARGTGEKRSPRKARRQGSVIDLDCVGTGRVTKTTQTNNGSPKKRRNASQVKGEMLEASTSTSSSGDGNLNSGDDEYLPAGLTDPNTTFDTASLLNNNSFLYSSFELPGSNANTSMTMEGEDWGREFDEFEYA